MKEEEIINELVLNKELSESPLLISWIEESDENRDAYIAYKNNYALMQIGAEMKDSEIIAGLKSLRKPSSKSNIHFLSTTLFKYAAILILGIIGGYMFHLSSVDSNVLVAMNEISVPEGNRSLITLPDGSKVILVNGSKIIYPSNFTGSSREVVLEGEAYLTIAHNKEKPFKVNVGEHQVEVLGTEFLVTAYPEDDLIMVDLVSGKVKMNVSKQTDTNDYDSFLLSPKEGLTMNKTTGDVKLMKIQDDFYKFWKEGEYVFKKESFSSLANKLERIYHLSIKFEDEALRSCKFTGALYSKSTIISTLETFKIASSIPFEYKIENNEVYINVKSE